MKSSEGEDALRYFTSTLLNHFIFSYALSSPTRAKRTHKKQLSAVIKTPFTISWKTNGNITLKVIT